jgi:hypothetical protein
MVIIVGLTGVGKSATLELLAQNYTDFTVLPNRRDVADEVVMTLAQQAAGEPVQPVKDRVKRFEYAARYRMLYPGGMAHALSRLAVNPARTAPVLIFDGLRGLEEAQYAVSYFPQTLFVVLDAPDKVRLRRLLGRGDSFDITTVEALPLDQDLMAALQSVPGIGLIFNEDELRQIAGLSHAAAPETVIQKAAIIVEERRNYDSSAARIYLTNALPPEQVLVLDTTALAPPQVAASIAQWCDCLCPK